MKRARRMYRPNLTLTWHWKPANESLTDVPGLTPIVPRVVWGPQVEYQPGDVVSYHGERLLIESAPSTEVGWMGIRWLHAGSTELPSGWRRERRSSRTQRSTT